jgi:Domain of unknown function (DUF1707)
MTGEQPHDGDAVGGPVAKAELRVSHADRDRVVELLREAAGDGRLTAEELDERVESALTARTGGELAVLTADLPAKAGAQPKELIKFDQRFGDVTRQGHWVVPQRMEIRAKASTVKLDFTEAEITFDSLRIDVDLGFGSDLLIVTKPGIVVLTDDLTVRMGDIKISRPRAERDVPVILRIEVAGRVRGGDIVARPPRRSPGQWIRREKAG